MASGYFSLPRPRLFGHRGAAGVAPENTLESFRRAIADGAAYLELDVHATRDGEIVVIHDPTVDRTTDGSGTVRDMTLPELRRLDAGYRFESSPAEHPYRGKKITIPTLREVIAGFPGTPLNVEVKQEDPPIAESVVRIVRESAAEPEVVLAAENDGVMQRLRAVAPDLALSFSTGEVRDFFTRVFTAQMDGYEPPGRVLQIPARFESIELVTPATLRVAHHFDLEIHVWTVNDPEEIETLLGRGADGIMSDFPARLRQAVQSREGDSGRTSKEMRRHPRAALGARGTIRFDDGRNVIALFLDVSFGGTRVEASITGAPTGLVGKTVVVDVPELNARAHGRLGVVNATIVWARKLPDARTMLGLKFAASAASKLRALLPVLRREEDS